jgi:hypothetical protein
MPASPVTRNIQYVLNADITAKIASFANAHRQAMDVGDKTLQGIDEKAILLAMVARSATDTLSWIKTRVPDGDRHAALFADLAAELAAKNTVGKGLRIAEKQLLSQAKQLTLSAVGAGMTPVWVTSGIAFAAGFLGSVLQFGSAVGGVLALGFFFLVSTAVICPPFRMAVFRSLGRTPQAVAAAGRSVKELAALTISALSYPGSVGGEAQRIFVRIAGKEGDALRYSGYIQRESRLVLTPLRILAGVIVWASMLALAISLVYLVIGVNHGFAQQANVCGQYSPSSYCGLSS